MKPVKRPCKGDYLDKFLQPAILSLLCEGPSYGFYLLTELERRGLVSNADATGFYRTLHKLETDGKLTSSWEIDIGDKPKKNYAITDRGYACLRNWQTTLRGYIDLVKNVSAAVDCALDRVSGDA